MREEDEMGESVSISLKISQCCLLVAKNRLNSVLKYYRVFVQNPKLTFIPKCCLQRSDSSS